MIDALKAHIRVWEAVKRSVYINCWARGEDESHALWRVYCPSSEGVAVRTTVGRLETSLPKDIELLPVGYTQDFESTTNLWRRVTLKRRMFSYEGEMRAVWHEPDWIKTADENPEGRKVAWISPRDRTQIRVHPESDASFLETVTHAVRAFAPALEGVVRSSRMAADPRMGISPRVQEASRRFEIVPRGNSSGRAG